MQQIRYAHMESQQRQYSEAVQSNCILGRRMAEAIRCSVTAADAMVHTRLAMTINLEKFPTAGTIGDWTRETPEYPEDMIEFGILTEVDILPNLLPFLDRDRVTVRVRPNPELTDRIRRAVNLKKSDED